MKHFALMSYVELAEACFELNDTIERVKVLHRESDSGGWCIQQEGGSNEVWPCPTARALGPSS